MKPTSGARGSEITVTGKGFGAGTATIELGTGDVLASNVAIEDGSFEHTLDRRRRLRRRREYHQRCRRGRKPGLQGQ